MIISRTRNASDRYCNSLKVSNIMGERLPSNSDGPGPFYNNPFLGPVVKAFQPLSSPHSAGGGCLERTATAAGMGLVFGAWFNYGQGNARRVSLHGAGEKSLKLKDR